MSYAYELADALASVEKHLIETGAIGKNTTISIAINQIRRQADRIAELEKEKTLTDDEIIAVGNAVVNHIDSNEGWIEFARAILRKAQEK
jgi:hypothetical protein